MIIHQFQVDYTTDTKTIAMPNISATASDEVIVNNINQNENFWYNCFQINKLNMMRIYANILRKCLNGFTFERCGSVCWYSSCLFLLPCGPPSKRSECSIETLQRLVWRTSTCSSTVCCCRKVIDSIGYFVFHNGCKVISDSDKGI